MIESQERNWLALVALGDEHAFRQLYDRYGSKVYRMALSYLKSPLEAQDAVQEIFLKVWDGRAGLSEVISFPAWLHVLARNHLINCLRKRIPVHYRQDLSRQDIPDKNLLPALQVDLREMAALIWQAVNALPPRQQQIYRLSRDKGMTLNQIALELGISYYTTREHMQLALKKIRVYLKAHYGELGIFLWLIFHR